MENTIKISCNIATTNSETPLGLEIWLNNQQIFNQDHVTHEQEFNYDLPDHEAEHELRFVMKNKNETHTIVDENGNIVEDACLTVSNLKFDDIQLGHLFTEKAIYTHDFNGSGQTIQEKFYGQMGCNGTVSLKFTTPMYLWLLENM